MKNKSPNLKKVKQQREDHLFGTRFDNNEPGENPGVYDIWRNSNSLAMWRMEIEIQFHLLGRRFSAISTKKPTICHSVPADHNKKNRMDWESGRWWHLAQWLPVTGGGYMAITHCFNQNHIIDYQWVNGLSVLKETRKKRKAFRLLAGQLQRRKRGTRLDLQSAGDALRRDGAAALAAFLGRVLAAARALRRRGRDASTDAGAEADAATRRPLSPHKPNPSVSSRAILLRVLFHHSDDWQQATINKLRMKKIMTIMMIISNAYGSSSGLWKWRDYWFKSATVDFRARPHPKLVPPVD